MECRQEHRGEHFDSSVFSYGFDAVVGVFLSRHRKSVCGFVLVADYFGVCDGNGLADGEVAHVGAASLYYYLIKGTENIGLEVKSYFALLSFYVEVHFPFGVFELMFVGRSFKGSCRYLERHYKDC